MIGSYHNIFRVGAILQDLGFWILNDVIWRKSNPMPNFRGRRFTNAHETLIWAPSARGGALHLQLRGHEGAERRAADAQRLAHPALHRSRSGSRTSTGSKAHPTQKPEALLHRVHAGGDQAGRTSSSIPFFGTGTTGVVARRLGRGYVGIEQHPAYARLARERIAAVAVSSDPDRLEPRARREEPRIPFGWPGRARPLAAGRAAHRRHPAVDRESARGRHPHLG